MAKGLGTGMLDKMVHGAFLGKRQLGRPLKYNFRTRGKAGYVTIHLLYHFLNGDYHIGR